MSALTEGTQIMKITLDAMGGDKAPAVVVEGAVVAHREYGANLLLVGEEGAIRRELKRLQAEDLPLGIRHASQRIEMSDTPLAAVKQKRDSSMRIAVETVQTGEASAIVSAGNTGALLVAATLLLNKIHGIDRPAITSLIPTTKGYSVLLDIGANMDCKPLQLFQFGLMGSAYAHALLKIPRPSVGLLNVGTEDTKGNKITKTAFELLARSSVNFIGNVEGTEVYRGRADVIVCDGFTGNVALKILEGLTDVFANVLFPERIKSWRGRLGHRLLQDGLTDLRQRMDYTNYGGAPLLGLNGICIKAHGGSNAKAIQNAIRMAMEASRNGLVGQIQREIESNADVELETHMGHRLWKQLRESIHRGDSAETEEEPPQGVTPGGQQP